MNEFIGSKLGVIALTIFSLVITGIPLADDRDPDRILGVGAAPLDRPQAEGPGGSVYS